MPPRSMFASRTELPAESRIVTVSVSPLPPLRKPTQTQTVPSLTVEPLELQPSKLVGCSAHGWASALKPSGKATGSVGLGVTLGVGMAVTDGLAPTLGVAEGCDWLTSGVGDGVDDAAPPKSPEITAPSPIAITPRATNATMASGPTRPERRSSG